jgi:hypothetical protein
MKQIKQITFILTIVALCGLALSVQAQTTSILTVGLERPTKIISAADNSLLVTEAGTFVPNTGRVSLVDRTTGARQTLINGLPSGVSNLGGPPEINGPSGLVLRGNTLYLTISSGDAVFSAGGPGLESPNQNPSSPLFDSVLELKLPSGYAKLTSPFTLSTANQATLAGGGEVNLANTDNQQMAIRLIANLPDFVPNPFRGAPNNVRSSNLFGIEIFQENLYVVDASRNLIHRVNSNSGQSDIFVTFAPKSNPLFPFGPPFVDAVPDNIHLVGNRLLVPFLTGFPFVQGLAEVRSVSLENRAQETFIPNLTSAIDVLHFGGEAYFTLEFSANQLANQPGRLKFFASPAAAPVVLVSDLISPTSMARDEVTGDIFVTEIFTGRIIRFQILRLIRRV